MQLQFSHETQALFVSNLHVKRKPLTCVLPCSLAVPYTITLKNIVLITIHIE